MDLDALEWHDGQLSDIQIKGEGEIELTCRIYSTESDRVRTDISLIFIGVTSFVAAIDFKAMKLNNQAGNIGNGRFERMGKKAVVLKIFLVDGYVELAAKKVLIRNL